jgi:hypothetical protein
MRKLLFVVLLIPALSLAAQEPPAKAPWDSFLKSFVGDWKGQSKGEPGNGKGERHYEFALQGKFLRMSHKAVYPPQDKNPKGEVHEDIGFFSYDKQRKKFVLRQFHTEGFVNEYVERETAPDGRTMVFVTDRIENIPKGWRARETYKLINPDEYTEVFELAEPGKDFAIYSQSRWNRVRP